jgi:hypothetical protein
MSHYVRIGSLVLILLANPAVIFADSHCATAKAHEVVETDKDGFYSTKYAGAYFIPGSDDCNGFIVDFKVKGSKKRLAVHAPGLYPSFPPPATGWVKITDVPCPAMNSKVSVYVFPPSARRDKFLPKSVTQYKGEDTGYVCKPVLIKSTNPVPALGYPVDNNGTFRVIAENEYFVVPPSTPPGTKVPFYTPVRITVWMGGPQHTLPEYRKFPRNKIK